MFKPVNLLYILPFTTVIYRRAAFTMVKKTVVKSRDYRSER